MSNTEYENQRTAGRQLSLSETTTHKPNFTRNKPHQATKKEAKPKGHEAFLKALETSGAIICVEFMESIPADQMLLTGVVKHSDAYTISLDVAGTTTVVFKHSIRAFTCLTPKEGE